MYSVQVCHKCSLYNHDNNKILVDFVIVVLTLWVCVCVCVSFRCDDAAALVYIIHIQTHNELTSNPLVILMSRLPLPLSNSITRPSLVEEKSVGIGPW